MKEFILKFKVPLLIAIVMAISSDGLTVLKLPFFTQQEIQAILCTGRMMDAYDLYEARKFHKAEKVFRECVAEYPDVLLPKINWLYCLLFIQFHNTFP